MKAKAKKWLFSPMAATLFAGLAALLFCLFSVLLLEEDGSSSLRLFFTGPFGAVGGLLSACAPALLVALGCSVVFQGRRYTLAGIGAFTLSAVLVTTFLLRGNRLPAWYLIPMALLIGVAAGVAVAALPAWMAVSRKVNLALASLLLNYAVLQLARFILTHILRDPAAAGVASFEIPQRMWLPQLFDSPLGSGLAIALLLTLLLYLLMYRGRLGYGVRAVGGSTLLAEYMGLAANRISLNAQLILGALAGLGGAVEMMGQQPRYCWNGTFPPAALIGLLAALAADYRPQWAPLATLFLTFLWQGAQGLYRATGFPQEIGLMAAALLVLVRYALIDTRLRQRLAAWLGSLKRPKPTPGQPKPEAGQADMLEGEVV